MSTALMTSNLGARGATTTSSQAQSKPPAPQQQSQTLQQRSQTPQSQSQMPQSQSQTPQRVIQSTPQAGTWRHPRFDEITRRQNASAFGSDSANRVAFNAGLLVIALFAPSLAYSHTPSAVLKLLEPIDAYKAYPILAVRLLFVVNILLALRPLFRTQDEVIDIPLTPSQRALLGLKPSNTPLTPGDQVMTPPRYARSTTPRSSVSRGGDSRSPLSGSPLTGRERSGSFDRSTMGYGQRGGSGSPYSVSPMVQKVLEGSAARRLSFDSGSGSSGLPNTPTPGVGTGRASVGLNNKWLYERGRDSPNRRSSLFT